MLSVRLHYRQSKGYEKRDVLKVISHVVLALTVSEILQFQISYLEKVGKGQSLANIPIFKRRSVHFCARSHRFSDINILRF